MTTTRTRRTFTDWAYTLCDGGFLVFLLAVIFLITCNNTETFYDFNPVALAFLTLIAVPFLWISSKILQWIDPKIAPFQSYLVPVFFLCYFALQVFVGWQLRVTPNDRWDFGVVYGFAHDYVTSGVMPDTYFANFSNNSGNSLLYLLFCNLFSFLQWIGISDFLFVAMSINAFLMTTALVFLYLTADLLLGKQKALFSVVLATASLAFLAYVPIIYTDTVSMPFAIIGVYCYTRAVKAMHTKQAHHVLWFSVGMGASLACGALIKQTVWIVLIAIVIDVIFRLRSTMRYKMLVLSLGVAWCINILVCTAVAHDDRLPHFDEDLSFPLTHWVMMGLYGNGGYHDPDAQATLHAGDYDAKVAYNLAVIDERLDAFGVDGFFSHLVDKLTYIYDDGTYTSALKLSRSPIAPKIFHSLFAYDGARFRYVAYATFFLQVCMLVLIAHSTAIALRKRDDRFTFLRIAVIGLTLFLLIFEARSRYLLNFLPIYLLLATDGIPTKKQEL